MKATVLSLSLATLLLAACGESNTPQSNTAAESAPVQQSLSARMKQKGATIVVATEGDYAPFSFHDESGKLTGYDVEVVRAVADKLGVVLEFRELKWVGILPGLEKGQFDWAANQISLSSPERAAKFDKSTPYSWAGNGILVRANDDRIKSYADIAGKSALQATSSSFGELASKDGASVIPVESMTQAANLIAKGQGDFTMNNALALMHYIKQRPENGVKLAWSSPSEEKKGAGIVILKGNDEALAQINQAMDELKKDGTLKNLGEQFFGTDVSER